MNGFEEHDAQRYAKKLHEEKDDLLAHMRFPKANGKRLRTINSVKRLNWELNRRTNVVGVFLDRASILRLGSSYRMQQHDSWISGKCYFNEESMQQLMEDFQDLKSKVVKLN